ncbi:MAG TPA: MBL fold metallo-hydrolase [Gaiellaceae bacterium]|jgi:glyoxylase-like metal-dependent hydrolase (beta-lactamase superfamily II)
MREVRPGISHWQAPHPGWSPDEPWDQEVSSYALDDGERVLLVDPIDPPAEVGELLRDREVVILLTNPWHERATQRLVERLGAHVYAPRPDSAEDLMRKYGLTAEQAGDGSPDLAWLLAGDAGLAHWYSAADPPFGAVAFAGRDDNDLVLWVERHGVVITGDSLVDFGSGLEIPQQWLREGLTREQVAESLRPLLDFPVEHVLATHGGVHDRAALERALA